MMNSNYPSTYGTTSTASGARQTNNTAINLPVTTQQQQMSPIIVHKPAAAAQAGPRTKGQESNTHQILFNQRQGIPTPAFSTVPDKQSSTGQLKETSKTSEEKSPSNSEPNSETANHKSTVASKAPRQRKPATATSSRKTSKSTTTGTSGGSTTSSTRRKTTTTGGSSSSGSSSSSRAVRARWQGTGAVAQVAATTSPAIPTSNVFQRRLQTYELRGHWGRKDTKGTRWLEKVPEDADPRRLSDIPIDPPNNEVEFTFWEPFNGKVSSGFTLYTSMGYRYWADAGAIRWLNAAEREGYSPSNSIFVVKHTKGLRDTRATLSYGFRKAEDPIEVEDDDDEEMLPEAKDAEMSADEDHEYLRTPKVSDDEPEEEEKNEFD